MLHKAVVLKEKQQRLERTYLHKPDLRNVIEIEKPGVLWSVARKSPKILFMCTFLMNTVGRIMSANYTQRCKKCGLLCENLIVHLVCFCTVNNSSRIHLWYYVIVTCGMEAFVQTFRMCPEDHCWFFIQLSIDNNGYCLTHYLIAKTLWRMLT